MIKEKQITIIKMRNKVNIKSNSNKWNWKKNIQNNIYIYIYIYIYQKFEDQIWYNQQIIWYF